MNLDKLYKMQAELDKHIYENNNVNMTKEELLDNTILALLVEVGELANTTRCFKHWSTKGMMEKEVVLEELADCWHFYLSIGNQIAYNATELREVENNYKRKEGLSPVFKRLYYWTVKFDISQDLILGTDLSSYQKIGDWIKELANRLEFTNEEVEQAYLDKHKENYKRQEEGY